MACAAYGHHRLEKSTSLICLTVATVYFAENINTLGARHWTEFATQDYFDRHGVFISLLFSLPLMVIALYIVVRVESSGQLGAKLLL